MIEESVPLSFVCKELNFVMSTSGTGTSGATGATGTSGVAGAVGVAGVTGTSGEPGGNNDELSRYLVGLKVQEAFGMYLGKNAKICQLPEEKARIRKGRTLAIEWQELYEREKFDYTCKDSWERMVESPDGDLQQHPHYVIIEMGESKLKSHQKLTFIQVREAKRMLRKASVDRHYHSLKLLFIAARDERSPLSILPEEITLRIAHYIAPHAFGLTVHSRED